MPPNKNDHLTDDEREAIEDLAAETAAEAPEPEDAAEPEDRPWLNSAREEMRQFLTDEELAALSEDDDGEAAPEDEAASSDDGDDDGAGEDPAPAEAATPPEQEAAPEPEAPAKPEPAAPTLTADEIAAIRAETREAMDALDDKYDDGEMTREQLRAKRDEIMEAEQAAIDAKRQEKAEAAEITAYEQRVEQHRAAAKTFFNANPVLSTPENLPRFDWHQRQVQIDPLFEGKSSVEILTEAKARMADEAKRQGKEIAGLTDAPKRPAHATTKTIPPTLATVPVAAVNSPEGSDLARKAAQIDAADALEAERLMARLSPEEQDRVLQGDY